MGCGEWQCQYGAWHDTGERCDCQDNENGSAADQSNAEPNT